MKTILTNDNINEFLIRIYFDISDGYEMAAIKRAYRDFNRTLVSFNFDELIKNDLKSVWINKLLDKITEITSINFNSFEEFTLWHQKTCYELIIANKEYKLSQGQAQKWINMTLKYLFVMGENRIKGINTNYHFFHVPIDNIIMEKFEKHGIRKFDIAWSKIKDYESYYQYQLKVKDTFKDKIPMDVEFELFNIID